MVAVAILCNAVGVVVWLARAVANEDPVCVESSVVACNDDASGSGARGAG